jgi:2,5-dihydroxypyridine 5,6-dioxygenase
LQTPVTLTIEQGFITDIRGGLDAELLSSYIQVHSTTTAATECRT